MSKPLTSEESEAGTLEKLTVEMVWLQLENTLFIEFSTAEPGMINLRTHQGASSRPSRLPAAFNVSEFADGGLFPRSVPVLTYAGDDSADRGDDKEVEPAGNSVELAMLNEVKVVGNKSLS